MEKHWLYRFHQFRASTCFFAKKNNDKTSEIALDNTQASIKKVQFGVILKFITSMIPLIRLLLIFFLIFFHKNVKGSSIDVDEVMKIVNTLQENFKIEKSRMESTISNLQAGIDSNIMGVETNAKLIDAEVKSINDTMVVADELSLVVNR